MEDKKVWASRKIARRIAKARMQHTGILHPNKARYGIQAGLPTKMPSYFAENWRRAAQ